MSNSSNPFVITFYIYCISMIAVVLIVAKSIDASNSVSVYGYCVYIMSIILMLVRNSSSTNVNGDDKNNDEEALLSPSDYKGKSRMLNSSISSILFIYIYCNSMIAILLICTNSFYASNSTIVYGYCIYITFVIVMLVRGSPSTNFNNDDNNNNAEALLSPSDYTNYKGKSRMLNSLNSLTLFYIFYNILLIFFNGFGASNSMIIYGCWIYIMCVILIRVRGNSSTNVNDDDDSNNNNNVEALLPPSDHTNDTEKSDHHLIDMSEIIEKKAVLK